MSDNHEKSNLRRIELTDTEMFDQVGREQLNEMSKTINTVIHLVNNDPSTKLPRKIKFRGKRTHDGGWMYGSYITIDHVIVADNKRAAHILPSTVGQFTNICDNRGAEIYEGDIISQTNENGEPSGAEYEVVFAGGRFCLRVLTGHDETIDRDSGVKAGIVIDNIHDRKIKVEELGIKDASGPFGDIKNKIHSALCKSSDKSGWEYFDPLLRFRQEKTATILIVEDAKRDGHTWPEIGLVVEIDKKIVHESQLMVPEDAELRAYIDAVRELKYTAEKIILSSS